MAIVYACCTSVMYLIWRLLYSLIIKWVKVDRQILAGVYLAIIIVAAFVPLYFTLFYWHSKLQFHVNYFLLSIIASYIVLVIFGILLYKMICQVIIQLNQKVSKAEQDVSAANEKIDKSQQDISKQSAISAMERQYHTKILKVHASEKRTIEVRCFPTINKNYPKTPISLNWPTFMEGVEFLWEQIYIKYGRQLTINLYVGINNIGAAIASILAARGGRVNPVEFISTKPDKYRFESIKKIIGEKDLEYRPDQTGVILVCDFKVKSGNAIKKTTEFLMDKYGDGIKIKFAVFVAPFVKIPVRQQSSDMETILTKQRIKLSVKPDFQPPDFLAFISYNDVMLPHEIR